MKKINNLILVSLLVFTLLASTHNVAAEGDATKPLEKNEDGAHEVRVEASQWSFVAYDMVKVNRLINEEGMSESDAMEEGFYEFRIGTLEKGGVLILSVVSRDVQHGFALNELGVQIATNRPGIGEEFGVPVVQEVELPDEDVTYSAFCQIFCGLGHPDMKLKFVIGEGSKEYGKQVYYTIIAINIAILGFTLFRLMTKVTAVRQEITA